MVDGSRPGTDGYSRRTKVPTHELLHNVVGEMSGDGVRADGAHTNRGWLATVNVEGVGGGNDEYLSAAPARVLSGEGLRASPAVEQTCS